MPEKKRRLDEAVVQAGLAANKDQARRLIMAGAILVDDTPADKPGTQISGDAKLRSRQRRERFVSRAGGKLAAALEHFTIEVVDKTCLDLGASTGGFTDCLLQAGAAKVYAVDVGTNQLDYRLRNDPRVVCLERTHAKNLTRSLVPDPINILTVDVSFTSLRYVLPPMKDLLADQATAICLFKPQFEVERGLVGAGGIVAESDGETATASMIHWLEEQDWHVRQKIKSPVKGREGNQEFLFWLES